MQSPQSMCRVHSCEGGLAGRVGEKSPQGQEPYSQTLLCKREPGWGGTASPHPPQHYSPRGYSASEGEARPPWGRGQGGPGDPGNRPPSWLPALQGIPQKPFLITGPPFSPLSLPKLESSAGGFPPLPPTCLSPTPCPRRSMGRSSGVYVGLHKGLLLPIPAPPSR